MVAKLLWKSLTFWDEMQITYINIEEEKIKKYENFSIHQLKEMKKELDLEIWDLNLDIHYHENEISDLELKKEEKEEELQNIEKALELR